MNIKQILLLTALVASFLAIPGVRMAICSVPIADVIQGIGFGFESIYSLAIKAKSPPMLVGYSSTFVVSAAITVGLVAMAVWYALGGFLYFVFCKCGSRK